VGSRVAIITGAYRGLGLEVSRALARQGIVVVLTARDRRAGMRAASEICSQGGQATFFPLDVTKRRDVDRLATFVDKTFGRLDILVNNAGVFSDQILSQRIMSRVRRLFGADVDSSHPLASTEDTRNIHKVLETNTYGPFHLCQMAIPMMKRGGYGRIVNVSSSMGQLNNMTGGWPAYRISKVALNALTRMLADELRDSDILVNSADPGHVKTHMGGEGAPRSVEEGADTIVWLAMLSNDGPTGGLFLDRKLIAW
jgi:NAD(P)-dependent dehydrogenase (short-subunit alcohol dehydrogenase family)